MADKCYQSGNAVLVLSLENILLYPSNIFVTSFGADRDILMASFF